MFSNICSLDPLRMKNRLKFLLFILILLASNLLNSSWASAENTSPTLYIEIQDKGIAIVHGRVDLPTTPEEAFNILSDYEQWPALFPEGFHIEIADCFENCTVVADMIIPHAIVPWTTHLRAKSIEHPPNTFELHLIDGDYLQYQLKWEFEPGQEAEKTHATMDLLLQPKGWLAEWAPDFFYEWTIRKGLEDHFKRVEQQVTLKSENSSRTNR